MFYKLVALKGYCLGKSPNDDNISWLCWDCTPNDTNSESSEESQDIKNGVYERTRLATEDHLEPRENEDLAIRNSHLERHMGDIEFLKKQNEELKGRNEKLIEELKMAKLDAQKNEDLATRNSDLERHLGDIEFLNKQNEELKGKNEKLTEELKMAKLDVQKNEDFAGRNSDLERHLCAVLDQLKVVNGKEELLKKQNEELNQKNEKLSEVVKILSDEVLGMRSPRVEDCGTKDKLVDCIDDDTNTQRTKSLNGTDELPESSKVQSLPSKRRGRRPKKQARTKSLQEQHLNDVNNTIGESIPKRNHNEVLVTEETTSMLDQDSNIKPPATKKSLPLENKVSSSSSVMAGDGGKDAEKQCPSEGATTYKGRDVLNAGGTSRMQRELGLIPSQPQRSSLITEGISCHQSDVFRSSSRKMNQPSHCGQM